MAVAGRRRGSSRIKTSADAAAPALDHTPPLAAIASVVEAEIVPRLLAAHNMRNDKICPPPSVDAQGVPPAVDAADASHAGFVAAFAGELIRGDDAAIRLRIEGLGQGGLAAEAICLQVLAPAARYLGEMWNEDRCSFLDVTTGTVRLHGIMNGLRPAFAYSAPEGVRPRCAMLVTAPGEQHRFGLAMLAEFFRRESWQVSLPIGKTAAQIAALAAARPIDMVGFSAGSDRQLGALAACIASLRASSYNPDILVMVGGPIFVARPDLVPLVGADATAANAEEAVQRAASLLQARRTTVARRVARVRAAPARLAASAAARGRVPSHAQ